MFNNFFIMIGGSVLSVVNFFKNISFKNIKTDKLKSDDIDSSIFEKLDLTAQPIKKSESKLDEIRDKSVKYIRGGQAHPSVIPSASTRPR